MPGASAARLLRLELRRDAMPWLVPVLAALFVFDPYRSAMTYPPIWDVRASVLVNKLLPDFVAFVAGMSAWAGSRDSRRHTADLVAVTARPRWARQAATLASAVCWALAAYLAMAAVLYGVIARHASWGGPPVWPAAVGAAALTAVCAAGFAAGAFFPGRFTAPLAGVGAFLVSLVAFKNAVGSTGGATLLSPSASVPISDAGIFYHALPDLPIAQVMFLAGVAVAAVGVLGLPAAAGGRRMRRAATAVTVTGLVAAGTAVGLTSTARLAAHGVVILALHDAASDRPIRYPPVCGGSAIPVCVHPAFRGYLRQVTTALDPVLREVAGLPGAPVSAVQVAASNLGDPAGIGGSPPAYHFTMLDAPRSPGTDSAFFAGSLRVSVVQILVTGSPAPSGLTGTQAQQAVEAALLSAVGVRDRRTHSADRAVSAAARRFAALPVAARHAWLVANLAALRAGHITVSQLP